LPKPLNPKPETPNRGGFGTHSVAVAERMVGGNFAKEIWVLATH